VDATAGHEQITWLVRTQTIFVDRPSRVETMAGPSSDQVDRLVIAVYTHGSLDPARRRAVGPYRSVLVVLIYLRHNLSQALVAELFGCSQPTVSRLISRLAPRITTALSDMRARPWNPVRARKRLLLRTTKIINVSGPAAPWTSVRAGIGYSSSYRHLRSPMVYTSRSTRDRWFHRRGAAHPRASG